MSISSKTILVTGDDNPDYDIYLHSDDDNPGPETPPTIIRANLGGAGIVARVLQATQTEAAGKNPLDIRFAPFANSKAAPTAALWHRYPLGGLAKSPNDQKLTVWRTKRSLSLGKMSDTATLLQLDKIAPPPTTLEKNNIRANIVVIEDNAGGFRFEMPAPFKTFLQSAPAAQSELIILKTTTPICQGDLWWTLSASTTLSERLMVIVSVKDLRRSDIRVSQGISWERTAQDLAREILESPALSGLRVARHVIVTLHGEGALWMERIGEKQFSFKLFFDPAHMEGEWSDKVAGQGNAYGFHSCFAASVAARCALEKKDASEGIQSGIERGLLAMRMLRLLGHGFTSEKNLGLPAATLGRLLSAEDSKDFADVTVPQLDWAKLGFFKTVEIQLQDKRKPEKIWRILETENIPLQEGKSPLPLYGKARRVALLGLPQLDGVPYARFGQLLTADRDEIEALRNLKRLIQNYEKDKKETKPLSLAVFGPPGAGKSFGIKQIAREILGEKNPCLEFNLSQFCDSDDLIGAFHQVRDKALEGHLPVVFWDEFDSQNYKWLQFLLAPMQDGKFQQGELTHPIGRCVFVFAGATSYTYDNFGPENPAGEMSANDVPKKDGLKDQQRAYADFVLKKGPDFISRLHGFLNVLGPNPRKKFENGKWEDDPSDICFPVRRAIFLRSMLGLMSNDRGKTRLEIDPGLLTALLEVGHYKHGARSFEKILSCLKQDAKNGFQRSALPTDDVLKMSVNDFEQFKDIMDETRAFQEHADDLAAAIHTRWSKVADAKNIFKKEFSQLDEETKNDNRAAALRIPYILGLAGLQLVVKKDKRPSITNLGDVLENQIEILAEEEHIGWMDVRLKNGWRTVVGTDDIELRKKNRQVRLHDCLIPFKRLPSGEQDKDRDSIRWYTKISTLVDFKIVARGQNS